MACRWVLRASEQPFLRSLPPLDVGMTAPEIVSIQVCNRTRENSWLRDLSSCSLVLSLALQLLLRPHSLMRVHCSRLSARPRSEASLLRTPTSLKQRGLWWGSNHWSRHSVNVGREKVLAAGLFCISIGRGRTGHSACANRGEFFHWHLFPLLCLCLFPSALVFLHLYIHIVPSILLPSVLLWFFPVWLHVASV